MLITIHESEGERFRGAGEGQGPPQLWSKIKRPPKVKRPHLESKSPPGKRKKPPHKPERPH